MAADPRLLREVVARNRREAIDLSTRAGRGHLRELLARAEQDLVARIHRAEGLRGPGKDSFTAAQLRTTLAQVRDVTHVATRRMRTLLVGQAGTAADAAAGQLVDYLGRADRAFRGLGRQPLQLREAAVLDAAREGAQSSLLRRLASSGEPVAGAEGEPHRAKRGILERYGVETVGRFEEVLQRGLVTRKPWADVRAELVESSPFLQQAPAFWAERICRSEVISSFNRAGWEGMKEANKQLGDMVKVLSETFDERTAADSYAVHGQIRRNEEPFDSWYGQMMHPPARPNDRAIVTPHRMSWPIPEYLKPRSDGDVLARWHYEGRKGTPPPRPKLTTVPYSSFGRQHGGG